jgi:hypothetical protein
MASEIHLIFGENAAVFDEVMSQRQFVLILNQAVREIQDSTLTAALSRTPGVLCEIQRTLSEGMKTS